MKTVTIFGLGPIGLEYTKILLSMGHTVVPVGRRVESCKAFENITSIKTFTWDEFNFQTAKNNGTAIVSVGEAQLGKVTEKLILAGYKNILVEKPGGSSYDDIERLASLATEFKCNVRVAYNRRFYASVLKGKEIINDDGGARSFHFDFSEWSHKIEPLTKEDGVKERWFIHNSSHVVDLAFYLGGWPKEISCLSGGPMSWHSAGIFVGMGCSNSGALFSYNADWVGPGRWSVEIITTKHRLVYKPLEKLQIQKLGSVEVNLLEIDDAFDSQFKPGFYRQVEAFLSDNPALPTIQEQCIHLATYRKICPIQ
ncbi:gfo/Idh/MocA family oxidoreductase [Vibrio cholerae]|uniref:gfo/Idh/MocA family oxidoreductase n=1 Tax=Vibrio cholerae TaxID=666 RepID=UPI00155EE0FD|nr:gfo/Idh/MocA family oxidoreductase [Vibrio cholerae]NOE79306.1 gfo/Idh/MocA family oxidoreductase [Vibrio cholerae]